MKPLIPVTRKNPVNVTGHRPVSDSPRDQRERQRNPNFAHQMQTQVAGLHHARLSELGKHKQG